MRTIRYLGLAAVVTLTLGAGAAMAQEGPNATVSGSTWFGNGAPYIQAPVAGQSMIQSGGSDVDPQAGIRWWTPNAPYATPAVPEWTPGVVK